MANSGPNTSNSQFSIITFPQPQLDGKHVVFGQLVRGFTTLTMIEAAYDPSSGVLGTPMQEVVITACGELTPLDG
jgi:cyclophilin family peptidyl-prolyl cis-trans isomerase